jgi:signal peptidase I
VVSPSLGSKAYRSSSHTTSRLFCSFVAKPPGIAVLTSPIFSGAKNQTCANLGVMLARAGKNTLVVDCDFRKPALHEFFGLPNTLGMEQVLAGERKVEEVWAEPAPGLKMVPAGLLRLDSATLPSSKRRTSELLTSRRLSRFLASVRGEFDCVLVNASPIGMSFDGLIPAIQGGYVVLLVLEAKSSTSSSSKGASGRGAVGQAVRWLHAVGANFLLAPALSNNNVGSTRYSLEAQSSSRTHIDHQEGTEQKTLVTGGHKPRRADRSSTKSRSFFLEFLAMLVIGFALLFGIVQPFITEAFYIPTESMVPTLEVNDRVLVNKFIYRFSEQKRGDIIVFEAPDGEEDLIKRVEGVPGDTITVVHGSLIVNGVRQEEPYLNRELPDRSTYGPVTVPAGHVFAMGDNRANSADSRIFGPVPEEYVIGKAFVRVWPLNRMGGL